MRSAGAVPEIEKRDQRQQQERDVQQTQHQPRQQVSHGADFPFKRGPAHAGEDQREDARHRRQRHDPVRNDREAELLHAQLLNEKGPKIVMVAAQAAHQRNQKIEQQARQAAGRHPRHKSEIEKRDALDPDQRDQA